MTSARALIFLYTLYVLSDTHFLTATYYVIENRQVSSKCFNAKETA